MVWYRSTKSYFLIGIRNLESYLLVCMYSERGSNALGGPEGTEFELEGGVHR